MLSSDTTDWAALLEAFLLYRDWLDRHPHPGLLDKAVHPNCRCYDETLRLLDNWHQTGAYWTGEQELIVHRAEAYLEPGNPYDDPAVSARQTGFIPIRAVIEWVGTNRLVDASGTVHAEDPGDGPVEIDVAFGRSGRRWRLVSFHNLGPPDG